jgi:hypothetical protein
MRTILFSLSLVFLFTNSFPQTDTSLSFIFVPHPRNENKLVQGVLPAIGEIDFSKYNLILLGGDLTWYTSNTRTSMEYCDKLFKLDSPNTLWTLGNHDLGNPALIQEFTERPRFYPYYTDGITFLVLDTERDATGFTSSHILGEQLDLLKAVCDTIAESSSLVLLHHRLLWMIGNPDFASRIDSVGESTRQLDTSNFNTAVLPLLQQVKSRGIQVYCLGGDKSKVNISYATPDNIHFFASTMAPEYPDSINDVMIFRYSIPGKRMSWEFVPLSKVEKVSGDTVTLVPASQTGMQLLITQSQRTAEIELMLQSVITEEIYIQVFGINGTKVYTLEGRTNQSLKINLPGKGLYLVKATAGKCVVVGKWMVR